MIKYICRKCGYVIYSFGFTHEGLPTPEEIVLLTKTCPRCKQPLTTPKLNNIYVKHIDNSFK